MDLPALPAHLADGVHRDHEKEGPEMPDVQGHMSRLPYAVAVVLFWVSVLCFVLAMYDR